MAGLLSLPDELLTEIYIFAGQQTPALVRLSAVNRRLRAIWLQDADFIIAQVVQLKAPNHQDAIALTLLEARCPLPTTGFHTLGDSDQGPRLRLCLQPLMRNIDLASDICSQLPLEIASFRKHNPNNRDWDPITEQLEPLYYLVRHALVAYHWPSLRPSLYAALKALTCESLKRYLQICSYITVPKPGMRPSDHLLYKPTEQYSHEDFASTEPEGVLNVIADMWAFAGHVGWKLTWDREDGLPEDPGADFNAFGGWAEQESSEDIQYASSPTHSSSEHE
jgi:hypothetical protein